MFYLIFLIILFLILFTVVFSSLSIAPWVPTRKKDFMRICEMADFKQGEIFYDLGCGDGELIFYAAKNYQIKAVGLEFSLPFYFFCLIKNLVLRNKNIKFKFKNLFKVNLSEASVIYVFPQSQKKLAGKFKRKLERELKKGARIITYTFPITGWQAAAINRPSGKDLPVYLYTILYGILFYIRI